MRELYDPRLVEEESEAGASRLRAGTRQAWGAETPPHGPRLHFQTQIGTSCSRPPGLQPERSEGAASRLAPHPPRLRALLCAGPHAKGRFFVNGFLYL